MSASGQCFICGRTLPLSDFPNPQADRLICNAHYPALLFDVNADPGPVKP